MTESPVREPNPGTLAPGGIPTSRLSSPPGSAFLLRGGLLLAVALGLVAIVAYAASNPEVPLAQLAGEGSALQFVSPGALWNGLLRLDVAAYLTLTVLVLVAIPVARAGVVLAHLHRSTDRPIAWMGGLVLALMSFALLVLAPFLR